MSALTTALQTIAPGIASMLGGPLAGIGVAWLGKELLGSSSSSEEDLLAAIKDPSVLIKLRELDNQIPLELLKQQEKQTEVDNTEAANENIFVSGWRPAIGWVGALGLAFNYIGIPIANMVGQKIVPLDMTVLLPLIMALLGLGTMRTVEKVTRSK